LKLGEADIDAIDIVEHVTDEYKWNDSKDDLSIEKTLLVSEAEGELGAL
jgi:hypothetical protein